MRWVVFLNIQTMKNELIAQLIPVAMASAVAIVLKAVDVWLYFRKERREASATPLETQPAHRPRSQSSGTSRSAMALCDLFVFLVPAAAGAWSLATLSSADGLLETHRAGLMLAAGLASLFWLLSWAMVLVFRASAVLHRLTWDGHNRNFQLTEQVLRRLG